MTTRILIAGMSNSDQMQLEVWARLWGQAIVAVWRTPSNLGGVLKAEVAKLSFGKPMIDEDGLMTFVVDVPQEFAATLPITIGPGAGITSRESDVT